MAFRTEGTATPRRGDVNVLGFSRRRNCPFPGAWWLEGMTGDVAGNLGLDVENPGLMLTCASLANNGDPLKDSEQRNGKFISEASSLEDGFTESRREISLEDIVNSLDS